MVINLLLFEDGTDIADVANTANLLLSTHWCWKWGDDSWQFFYWGWQTPWTHILFDYSTCGQISAAWTVCVFAILFQLWDFWLVWPVWGPPPGEKVLLLRNCSYSFLLPLLFQLENCGLPFFWILSFLPWGSVLWPGLIRCTFKKPELAGTFPPLFL